MKRYIIAFIFLCTVFSITTFAVMPSVDGFKYSNGDLILDIDYFTLPSSGYYLQSNGTISTVVSSEPFDFRAFYDRLMNDYVNNNLCVSYYSTFLYISSPSLVSFKSGGGYLGTSFKALTFYYDTSSSKWNLFTDNCKYFTVSNTINVAFTYLLSYPTNAENIGYIPANTNVFSSIKSLIINDNKPEPTPDGDNGGILDFLSGFWDKLVSVFVPSSNYFSNFFNEIKNAFDVKFGFISGILDSFKASLNNINRNQKYELVIPANSIYNGFSGISVDFSTSMMGYLNLIKGAINYALTLITLIFAYRRITTIIGG